MKAVIHSGLFACKSTPKEPVTFLALVGNAALRKFPQAISTLVVFQNSILKLQIGTLDLEKLS